MARKYIEFELKPKTVKIYNIKLLSFVNSTLILEIECGSGTYIRAIGRDIAKELNSLATMTELVRTKVGEFGLEQCQNIQEITNLQYEILPIKTILAYETLNITANEKSKLLNGQTLIIQKKDGIYAVEDELDTVAIVKIEENKAKMSIFLG